MNRPSRITVTPWTLVPAPDVPPVWSLAMAADLPAWARAARQKWTHTGACRPSFALPPEPGQESVWDYPRPPAIVPDPRRIDVLAPDGPLARTTRAIRVLETSHPPSFYLPPDDLVAARLVKAPGSSRCEWKGTAEYLAMAGTLQPVGWRYPAPFREFARHSGWLSFYPDRVHCVVDGERVRAQPGGYYGGWITDEIVGPFKGDPGSAGW